MKSRKITNVEKILLIVLGSIDIASYILAFLYGYVSNGFGMLMDLLLFVFWAYIFVCIIILIINLIKKKPFAMFLILLIILIILGDINIQPIFESLGVLTRIKQIGPDAIASDARNFLEQQPSMVCYGNYEMRYPCDKPLPLKNLPESILRLTPKFVVFDKTFVEIKKLGEYGALFVYSENNDPLVHQKDFNYQNITCYELRIAEGLYWSIHTGESNYDCFARLKP
jgi:hypothetical protein